MEMVMEKTKKRPRVTFEVSESQYEKLKKHLEFGLQRRVFSIITDDVLNMLELYGNHFVIALMQRKVTYENFMAEYAKKNGVEKNEGKAN